MLSSELPKSMAIMSKLSGKYLRYLKKPEDEKGFVTNTETYVFNIFSKIEVEKAKTDDLYVNLRFVYSNKYWARESGGSRLRAISSKPEEDQSKDSCTLFEPVTKDNNFSFKHVATGMILTSPSESDGDGHVLLDSGWGPHDNSSFVFVDLRGLVVLPKNVAFKGDNGMYLRDFWKDGSPYLQFSAADCSDTIVAGHRVSTTTDGNVRIISNSSGKFWRRGPDCWVLADASDAGSSDKDILFRPVKVSDNAIALVNAGNEGFCKRYSGDLNDCLNAVGKEVNQYSRLEVQELLVLERQITNVTDRTEDARIYDSFTNTNSTSFKNYFGGLNKEALRINYKNMKVYSFTNGSSLRTVVKTTIDLTTGFPVLNEKGEIEIVSATDHSSLGWNTTVDESALVEEVYYAFVPIGDEISIDFLSSEAKCDVPFSYTQIDKLSDGRLVTTQHHDGLFTALNTYNCHFTKPKITPLALTT